MCSNVILGASRLYGAVEGRYERSMEKTGVGSCILGKSQRAGRCSLL